MFCRWLMFFFSCGVSFPPLAWRSAAMLLVDILLVPFGFRGFRRRHLPAADAVRDPLLLIIAARADFVVAVGRGIGVVLVVVDRLAEVVLLLVDLPAFLRRQRAAIGGAVVVNFACSGPLRGFPDSWFRRPSVVRRRRRWRCGPAGCSGAHSRSPWPQCRGGRGSPKPVDCCPARPSAHGTADWTSAGNDFRARPLAPRPWPGPSLRLRR